MFLLSQFLLRSTPKLQLLLWYCLLVLLLYSFVTYQAKTYQSAQTKEFVHFALWTALVMPFLRNVCYGNKITIELPDRLLSKMLTSSQAIQTKTKALTDL